MRVAVLTFLGFVSVVSPALAYQPCLGLEPRPRPTKTDGSPVGGQTDKDYDAYYAELKPKFDACVEAMKIAPRPWENKGQ